MPRWKFPIDPIRFTDDKMKRAKAEYVAEHGYELHLPGITEMITLWNPTEPDDAEFAPWKRRNRAEYLIGKYPTSKSVPRWREESRIPMAEHRYNEITKIVDRKRARYRRMLASPTPTWMTNIASVMTWFDDVNDLLGTAGVIFRTAAFLVPKVAKRFFLGPAGWLFLAADIFGILLSLTSSLMGAPFHCTNYKRHVESVRDANPFSTKSRQRRARKLRRFRPSWGEIIEGAQSTHQTFGRGLCLGPILGAAYDIGFGVYRAAKGERVTLRTLHPTLTAYENLAYKTSRELAALGLATDELTEEDHFRVIMAAYVSQCAIRATILEWNPLDQVDGLQHMRIPAEGPIHPSTRYVLEEFGIKPGERIGWPFLDKEYVSYDEIWNTYRKPLEKATMQYFIRNRYTEQGLIAAQNAKEAGLMFQSNIEGTNPIELINMPVYQAVFDWTSHGCLCKGLSSISTGGYPLTMPKSMSLGRVAIQWACAGAAGSPTTSWVDSRGRSGSLPSSLLCPGYKRYVHPPGRPAEWELVESNIVTAEVREFMIDEPTVWDPREYS